MISAAEAKRLSYTSDEELRKHIRDIDSIITREALKGKRRIKYTIDYNKRILILSKTIKDYLISLGYKVEYDEYCSCVNPVLCISW